MHSPGYGFFLVIILLELGIAWLVLFFLGKLFPFYRKKNVIIAFWILTGMAYLAVILGRYGSSADIAADLMMIAFMWLIGQVFALMLMPFLAAAVRLNNRQNPNEQEGMSRREFLGNLLAAAPVAALGVSAYGVYSGGFEIILQCREVALPQLPASLNGFKIAQISDTHIGLFFSVEKLSEVLEQVLREKPDLLVITGDLVDDVNLAEQMMQKLAAVAGDIPYGIYFCWGNHEYFRDINKVRQALKNSPVILLENTAAVIVDGDEPFYLAGVDYPWAKNAAGQIAERERMMKEVMDKVPDGAFTVLLAHHPDFIDNAFDSGIPLTLTGHTHGGQVAVFGRSLLPVQYHYMRGMYTRDDMYGYVHTGTGSWMPFRLGCPAEIAIFTLKTKK